VDSHRQSRERLFPVSPLQHRLRTLVTAVT
jgi:hypothetical protein